MTKHIKETIEYNFWGMIIALLFFLIGLLTLSDYGINIDEPIHFMRGQAYLNFLLTGHQKYSESDLVSARVSEWKYKGFDAAYFLKNDAGHPPLNGILAAATNRVFYEKLGLLGDLEAYHLFELFVSTLLVFLVFTMVRSNYGVFAAFVATLSLAVYPLFYGESHFNIKDPVEASFFAFSLYFFYLGLEKTKGKYFFISSLFCALALGTKFNIVFLPFIFFPYLIIRYLPFVTKSRKLEKLKKIPHSVYLSLLFYPLIVLGIHFLTRPYLWADPLNRFLQIVQYYKDIGTGMVYESSGYIKHGWNFYPVFFIAASTPPIILFFFLTGFFSSLVRFRQEQNKFSLLVLLWFLVVLLRVMWPGTSIYGGVRQIMEYVPAMAVIAGIGAFYIREILRRFLNFRLATFIILMSFVPALITLARFHPNENIYLNFLVGGLKGAAEKKIPGAGETMGNVYLQGIRWLSKNAEKNAHFGFPIGLGSNFSPEFLRKDIKFGAFFSGTARKGEYMMEMDSVDLSDYPRYHIFYLKKFLNPVYTVTVDGFTIFRIWKNDKEHTKPGFLEEKEEQNLKVIRDSQKGLIQIELEKPVYITRLEIDHDNKNCQAEGSGQISYSPDGKKELLAPDDLYGFQGLYALSLQSTEHFVYFFAAPKVKTIRVMPDDQNLCLLQVRNVKIFSLKDIRP